MWCVFISDAFEAAYAGNALSNLDRIANVVSAAVGTQRASRRLLLHSQVLCRALMTD